MWRSEDKVSACSESKHFRQLPSSWSGCAVHSECTLHQISPYIGKIKSSIASTLIAEFSSPGQTVYDPFCGSGTVPLESWLRGRHAIGTDLSRYAHVLTSAKLSPPRCQSDAMRQIAEIHTEVMERKKRINIAEIEKDVCKFFHEETLRETLAWFDALAIRKDCFLSAALMGILHHQRPGFLSFPSSHTVPYLRTKLFPKKQFRQLYAYRPVRIRLEKKIQRIFKRVPPLDRSIYRRCFQESALSFKSRRSIDCIITSPPYMRQLDYGRDNRLRLWFLGDHDWRGVDRLVTPDESKFLEMMRSCLKSWHQLLPSRGWCILILGDTHSRLYNASLSDAIRQIAVEEVGGYTCEWNYADPIPHARRVRRSYRGSSNETILALKTC